MLVETIKAVLGFPKAEPPVADVNVDETQGRFELRSHYFCNHYTVRGECKVHKREILDSPCRCTGVQLAAAGRAKWVVKIGDKEGDITQFVCFTNINTPNIFYNFPTPIDLFPGQTISIEKVTLDSAQSLYSTMFFEG